MRYLTLDEVLELHRLALEQAGGAPGIRDLGALESAVAQPYMAFGGEELYPSPADKAAALAFSLIQNHAFVDGTGGWGTRRWKRSWCSTATSFELG
jgi:death-on-curing protein